MTDTPINKRFDWMLAFIMLISSGLIISWVGMFYSWLRLVKVLP